MMNLVSNLSNEINKARSLTNSVQKSDYDDFEEALKEAKKKAKKKSYGKSKPAFAKSEVEKLKKLDLNKLAKDMGSGKSLATSLTDMGFEEMAQNSDSLNAISEALDKIGLNLSAQLEDSLASFTADDATTFGSLIAEGVLGKNLMSLGGNEIAGSGLGFKQGWLGADSVQTSLDINSSLLPSKYREQLGRSLMALGQMGSSPNSMKAGADLAGYATSLDALKGIFSSMNGELGLLKLNRQGLPALGRILSESGVDGDSINNIMAQLSAGSLSMSQVMMQLEKINFGSANEGGLIATESGLNSMGQFFASLGASPEVVDAIVNGFKNGDKVDAESLRQIISQFDSENLLAPTLNEGDFNSLANFLQSMGARQQDLNKLSTLLSQSKGQLSMDQFLNFIDGMEKTPAQPVSTHEMGTLKDLIANISRQQELAKTPYFDEILIKIESLGDKEIDEDFKELSPALQALKGGITAMKGEGSAMDSGADKNNKNQDQDNKEQYRQILQAQNSESNPAKASQFVETMQSYGGHESLARQISQKLIYSSRRGIHRLRMNLNPASMGELNIELKLKGNEMVAHIRAKNREAYEALSAEAESLKEALKEGGIEISNMTISFDDKENGKTVFADLREILNKEQNAEDQQNMEQQQTSHLAAQKAALAQTAATSLHMVV